MRVQWSERSLRRVNVDIVHPEKTWLGCLVCHETWSPNILPGGRWPRGWWKCPRGCNSV